MTDSQLENDILSSNSFIELLMKANLSGCLEDDILMSYFINTFIPSYDDKLTKKCKNILETLDEDFKKLLITNKVASVIFKYCLKDGLNSNIYNNVIYMLDIIYYIDNNFIKNLKDENNNNVLMIMANMMDFETRIESILKVIGRYSTSDKIDCIFMSDSLLPNVIRKFVDCGVDIEQKNKDGKCFKDILHGLEIGNLGRDEDMEAIMDVENI